MTHRTRLLLAALVLGLAACIATALAIQAFRSPPMQLLLVPNVTNVQIQANGFLEQRITYHAPGPRYGWYFAIVRKLAADGWSMPVDTRVALHSTPTVYWRIWQVGLIYVEEEIAMQGEPDFAILTFRRRIIIPWRRYLP